jgi:hypothetical protein
VQQAAVLVSELLQTLAALAPRLEGLITQILALVLFLVHRVLLELFLTVVLVVRAAQQVCLTLMALLVAQVV